MIIIPLLELEYGPLFGKCCLNFKNWKGDLKNTFATFYKLVELSMCCFGEQADDDCGFWHQPTAVLVVGECVWMSLALE